MNKIGSSHENLNWVIEAEIQITEELFNFTKNFGLHSGKNAS